MSEPPTAPPETILFVEDETLVRMDMAEFLRECGYRVYEAATAKEAIEALQAKFAVDLVFTDINLRDDMNGLELGEWTLRERPGVKVLVTTGMPLGRSTFPKPSDLSWLSHTRAAICSTGYDTR